ncbi:MAG: tRNA lysidine(34) synthetase TilS [Alphaproteobacteria bacterium]|nr:tRNA lysidine(34) synthetase TilS [Alphaproteobacteria bacterium]
MQKLIFPELDGQKTVAVAVSGGADSMALAHMLARTHNVLALTVDHGLRADSADEAKQVASWLEKWPRTQHRILAWRGKKPKTGIMEAAREARYALLAKACKDAGIAYLALAHHADDQAETFFMRLSHGSGLDGLAGMKRVQPYARNLALYRPLLGHSHADLVAYCKANKIKWVEDPSNANTRFTRPRLRKALADEGLDAKRLAKTLARLERAANALGDIAASVQTQATLATKKAETLYDYSVLAAQPFEVFLRVLRKTLEGMGKGGYGPRLERLEELAAGLYTAKKRTKATLAGCIMDADPKRNTLKISREAV